MTYMTELQYKLHQMEPEKIAADLRWLGKAPAVSVLLGPKWQPIDTAPIGVRVLLWNIETQAIDIGFRPADAPHNECVIVGFTASYADAWHPLPAEPDASEPEPRRVWVNMYGNYMGSAHASREQADADAVIGRAECVEFVEVVK